MSFVNPQLTAEELQEFKVLGRLVRGDILKMTTVARSGHPGGSMSSCDLYLVVWKFAQVRPDEPDWDGRDRIVVSHGHTSPGVYAVLGRLGFFDVDDAIAYFRKAGSPFEGHVEREIPGVEWTTGNLGQGLSAGVGFALASKILKRDNHVFVIMSDAEQAKGQVAESRRIAKKYELNNITILIDYNNKQISGNVQEVMPVNIKQNYESDGWKVIEINGHDYSQIYRAIREAVENVDSPVCILAHTIMGKGVSFMENVEAYHGKPLSKEECRRALMELGIEDDLDFYIEKRNKAAFPVFKRNLVHHPIVSIPKTVVHSVDEEVATRVAVGNQLTRWGRANLSSDKGSPIAVFDCDLAESLRFLEFKKEFASNFFENGVQEHSTATVAGALSINGIISVFGDFGVFGVDETYNQHRLNDINYTNLKLLISHIGIDVGEDGKTHHCIDYIGVLRNLFSYKLIIPADANQAQKAFNYIMSNYGNYVLAVGRSNWPILADIEGKPFFEEHYEFEYGSSDVLRRGDAGSIIAYGATCYKAIEVYNYLTEYGIYVNVINVSSPFYLDSGVLRSKYIVSKPIFVYEDHNINTGLGAILADFYLSSKIPVELYKFGLSGYAKSGASEELYGMYNLAPESVGRGIFDILSGRE
ncbi:MAG TPA: transketolase [Candidatus Hydrothermia bacterium]|nr:transketolase [Candidatus Hydrothermia bacterium]